MIANKKDASNIGPPTVNNYSIHAPELLEKFYEPIPIVPNEKRPAVANWTTTPITPTTVTKWCDNLAHCGVGIRTVEGLVGLDVDIDCPLAVKTMSEIIQKHDCSGPTRYRSNSSRILAMLRCEENLRKFSVELKDENGASHKLELLATGQQFCAFGMHPSGVELQWRDGSPLDTDFYRLPSVTLDTINIMFDEFIREMESLGWSLHNDTRNSTSLVTVDSNIFLPKSSDSDPAEVKKMAKHLFVNRGYADAEREIWRNLIWAVKATFPPNEKYPGWLIEYCKSEKHPEFEVATEKVWDSYKYTDRSVGVGYLIKLYNEEIEKEIQETSLRIKQKYDSRIQKCPDENEMELCLLQEIKADNRLNENHLNMLLESSKKWYRDEKLNPPKDLLAEIKNTLVPENQKTNFGQRLKQHLMESDSPFINQHGTFFLDTDEGTMQLHGSEYLRRVLRVADSQGQMIETRAAKSIVENMAAHFGGAQEMSTYRRYGPTEEGGVLIDHCDGTITEVNCNGVLEIDQSDINVRFLRSNSMGILPPVKQIPSEKLKRRVDRFWEHLNIPDEYRILTLAVMMESMRSQTDFPILCLFGEKGSAKSTTAQFIVDLIDPRPGGLSGAVKNVDDLASVASNHHLTAQDNIKGFQGQEDTICRMATAGVHQKRKQYTDSDIVSLDLTGPFLTTSIEFPFHQEDTISRSIRVEMGLAKGSNRSKAEIQEAFEQEKPELFSALVSLLSETLAMMEISEKPSCHRFVDFCHLGQSLMDVLENPGDFETLLESNNALSRADAFESNPALSALVDLVGMSHLRCDSDGCWEGTMTQLLGDLNETIQSDYRRNRFRKFPANAMALSKLIGRHKDGLEEQGITVLYLPKVNGRKIVRLVRNGNYNNGGIRERDPNPDI